MIVLLLKKKHFLGSGSRFRFSPIGHSPTSKKIGIIIDFFLTKIMTKNQENVFSEITKISIFVVFLNYLMIYFLSNCLPKKVFIVIKRCTFQMFTWGINLRQPHSSPDSLQLLHKNEKWKHFFSSTNSNLSKNRYQYQFFSHFR